MSMSTQNDFADELDDLVNNYLDGANDPKEGIGEVILALEGKLKDLKEEQAETEDAAEATAE